MCHILLVLPLVAVGVFLFLPFGQAVMLYLFILLLCAILYWLIWSDMRRPVTLGAEGMIGGAAHVIESRTGRVKVFYHGEIWEAICSETLAKDEKVQIVGMERMKLIVKLDRTSG